jgi:hypothetical protein
MQFLPQETQHASITNISRCLLLREIITLYSENNIKYLNIFCGRHVDLLFVKSGGTNNYVSISKC